MRAFAALLVLALAGCQSASEPVRTLHTSLVSAEAPADGSDLLRRARASLTDGRVDPAMRAALAASPVAADRQAARLLAALDAPTPARAPEPPDKEPLHDAPRIKMGTAPPTGAPAPKPTVASASSSAAKPAATVATAAPTPAKPRAKLERVGLSSNRKGASLSLRGSGGLVVGVASQPASGIVRLVMDAEASTDALRSRPRVNGARVTGIRRTGKTVFVTLALDPGWSLRGIVRTRSGARVDLDSPA
mgnify:CR=1 FL=1